MMTRKNIAKKTPTTSDHATESIFCSQIPLGLLFLLQEYFQILPPENQISAKMLATMKENLNRHLEQITGLSKKTKTKFSSIKNFHSYFYEFLYCASIRDMSQPLTPFLGLWVPSQIR